MLTIINCWAQETSGVRAELINSGYERENKRADGQNQFMREKLRGPSRNRQCCFWVGRWSSWGPESNSGYRNIVGLPRQWSRSLLSGTTSGLDDGCTRVVHESTESCTSGARVRVVHNSSSGEGSSLINKYTICTVVLQFSGSRRRAVGAVWLWWCPTQL